MARVIMVLLGLILLGLGIWLGIEWWYPVLQPFLMALLVFFLVLFGLTLLIFGISEIAGSRAKTSPAPPTDEPKTGE